MMVKWASIASGDRRSLARALSIVEEREAGFDQLLASAAREGRRAHRVGITGAPGVGKSTLVAALIRCLREAGRTVAILAVDPTSPFTGGALLGDRIRMGGFVGDHGVFVRSVATRGALGGLGPATGDQLDLLEGAGFDVLLIETVGAGQVDLDVATEADTTVVVLAPGAGDGIQAMKSGLMEVADLWVVNKCDDSRAEQVHSDLISSLTLHDPPDDLEERVLLVSASEGTGVSELLARLDQRLASSEDDGRFGERRRDRLWRRVVRRGAERLEHHWPLRGPETQGQLAALESGRIAMDALVGDLLRDASGSHQS